MFNAETDAFVIGKDIYGCEKKIDFTISQFPVPELMLLASPIEIERTNPIVDFDAVSQNDLSECFFEWNMGDGNIETIKSFSYEYNITNQRSFNLGLLVTTGDGCKIGKHVTIHSSLNIPNTITPNGHGVAVMFLKRCIFAFL